MVSEKVGLGRVENRGFRSERGGEVLGKWVGGNAAARFLFYCLLGFRF